MEEMGRDGAKHLTGGNRMKSGRGERRGKGGVGVGGRREGPKEAGGKVNGTNATALMASLACRVGSEKITHKCQSNGPN